MKYTISDTVYKTIADFTSVENAVQLKNKLKSLENDKIVITNTGVVSSGKSTLFNALIGTLEERFKTGAARTTVAKDIEHLTDDIDIIDTPGIDVQAEDDEIALNAVLSSSLIVMVHNIKMGMLQQNEVNWLKRITATITDPNELRARFMFVCSWIDARMMEPTFMDTVNETKRILFDVLGTEVDVYLVSAKLYNKGMETGKEQFIEKSGINQLKTAMIEKAAYFSTHYGISAMRKNAYFLVDSTKRKLAETKDSKSATFVYKRTKIKNKYDLELSQWDARKKNLLNLVHEYQKHMEQLNKDTDETDVNSTYSDLTRGFFFGNRKGD